MRSPAPGALRPESPDDVGLQQSPDDVGLQHRRSRATTGRPRFVRVLAVCASLLLVTGSISANAAAAVAAQPSQCHNSRWPVEAQATNESLARAGIVVCESRGLLPTFTIYNSSALVWDYTPYFGQRQSASIPTFRSSVFRYALVGTFLAPGESLMLGPGASVAGWKTDQLATLAWAGFVKLIDYSVGKAKGALAAAIVRDVQTRTAIVSCTEGVYTAFTTYRPVLTGENAPQVVQLLLGAASTYYSCKSAWTLAFSDTTTSTAAQVAEDLARANAAREDSKLIGIGERVLQYAEDLIHVRL